MRPSRFSCGSLTLLAIGLVAGCGGGGGGGSGSGSVTRHPPGFFETQEYFANAGLEVLEASSAYASGATGHGIVVGVIDTGIDRDHPEFAGAIHERSTDIVTGSAASLGDVSGHGTAVAGVIAARRNGALAHGVAFDAELLVIRADAPGSCPPCGFDPLDVARATDYAVDHGARVINYSIGGAGSLDGALGDALEDAVKAGRIVVISAGNDGGDDPIFPAVFAGTAEARGRAIAVGALDTDGELASFSNKAGSARLPGRAGRRDPGTGAGRRCGSGQRDVVRGASRYRRRGAGAGCVAVPQPRAGGRAPARDRDRPRRTRDRRDLWPGLARPGGSARSAGTVDDPARIRGGWRRGRPARDGVAPGRGVRAGAGPGARDLPGRLRPALLGRSRPPSRRDREQAGPARLAGAGRGAPRLLGAAGRAWGAGVRARRAATARPARSALRTIGDAARGAVRAQRGLGRCQPANRGARLEPAGSFWPGERRPEWPCRPAHRRRLRIALSRARRRRRRPGARPAARRWSVRVGLARAERGDRDPHASGNNSLVLGELVGVADGLRLGLQLGQLEEQNRVLDASGGGALGLGEGSSTTFLGLAGRTELSPALELFGQASFGLTRPGGGEPGLLRDLSVLYSSSFGLGLARRDLAVAGDRVTVAIAQPLRVEAGDAALDRPLGRTFEGQIVRRRERIDLAPEGRELDLEIGYRIGLAGIGDLSVNWLTRVQPGHDAEARPDHALALRLQRRL